MKRSDRINMYKCNKNDLQTLINSAYTQDRFTFMMYYIARHGMYGGDTKDDLLDLIYTARAELIALEAKTRSEDSFKHDYKKMFVVNNGVQERVKEFIRNPVEAMKKELINIAKTPLDSTETDEDVIVHNNRLRNNCVMLATQLGVEGPMNDAKFSKYPDRVDIMNRLNKKIRYDGSVEKALNRINGGFLGKLFRRPSREYQAFETSLNFFRDYNNANNGDVEDLMKKTNAYLKHLIPDYDPEKLAEKKAEWLESLPKGQRNRALFAMKVVESVNEHETIKPYLDNIENYAFGRPIDESVEKNKLDLEPKVQKAFQKNLDNDVNINGINKDQMAAHENANKDVQPEVDINIVDKDQIDAHIDANEKEQVVEDINAIDKDQPDDDINAINDEEALAHENAKEKEQVVEDINAIDKDQPDDNINAINDDHPAVKKYPIEEAAFEDFNAQIDDGNNKAQKENINDDSIEDIEPLI